MPHITPLTIQATTIDGLLRIGQRQATDERGTVREYFRQSAYTEIAAGPWAQLNVTQTRRGAIRGLHGEQVDKLVGVVAGSAFGAWLDTRADSPSRGTVVTFPLEPGTQVFVPAGVCNGFQATGEGITQYLYCFTPEWEPGMAGTSVDPLDPALGIDWPLPVDPQDPAQISSKDAAAARWSDIAGEI